jgi:hypothetical protein
MAKYTPRNASDQTGEQRGHNDAPTAHSPYLPPIHQILTVLGIQHLDPKSSKTAVSTRGLLLLFREVLKLIDVDEAWYLQQYPDVRAAILSGDIPSAEAHFRAAGYFEGRFPSSFPFDASYYFRAYADLATTFVESDKTGLKNHFQNKGYREGRAGVLEHFVDAERWRTAADHLD